MASLVLITGGTGTLGSRVVRRLGDAGRQIRVLSRQERASSGNVAYVTGDLRTNEEVEAAVAGAEIVVHCAGGVKGDEETTRTLVQAASRADVRHLVFISVIGADRIPQVGRIDRLMFGYFGSKSAAERVVAESGLPWTTLRAAQFHQSLLMAVQPMAKLPVIPVPAGFQFQPVDVEEVAQLLVEQPMGMPAGLVPDFGRPKVQSMADLIRGYLRARGKHRPILPLWIPGKAARAIRAGANLAPDRAVGQRTWENFLADLPRHELK